MKHLFFIAFLSLFLHAQNILVINSNPDVKKYAEAVDEFSKNCKRPFKTLDISTMGSEDIKKSLYDEYPDIVYAVGAKAYQYANEYLSEKEIYFSSVVDWKRLALEGERYGVSNELHSGMQLTLIKYIFQNTKTIGVIHSKYTQNIINDLSQEGEKMGIKIIPLKIDEESVSSLHVDDLIKNSDAVMIISDPLFISDEKAVKNLFMASEKYKKPVIAYHELFIEYGATLVMSVDNPTIGRQIAAMIESNINKDAIEKIQYPAGTKVIINKKGAANIGLELTQDILVNATEIIE